jgi:hypothetical protein
MPLGGNYAAFAEDAIYQTRGAQTFSGLNERSGGGLRTQLRRREVTHQMQASIASDFPFFCCR